MRVMGIMALVCALSLNGLHPALAGESDDKKPPQNFVYLKPLMFPLVTHGGIDQFVSVTVTLEFDDPTMAGKANAIMPRIVDAYLQDLYGATARDKVVRDGVIDPTALKAELDISNSRILSGMPCHVLLDNIGQRTIHNSAS